MTLTMAPLGMPAMLLAVVSMWTGLLGAGAAFVSALPLFRGESRVDRRWMRIAVWLLAGSIVGLGLAAFLESVTPEQLEAIGWSGGAEGAAS